jgi:hypothetical protein
MDAPVVLNDTTASAVAVDPLYLDARHWRITLRIAFARFGCAALLLVTAALKAYQLFTDPSPGVLHGSLWLQVGLIQYELLLAIWLFSNVSLQWGRRIALVTFLGFGCYAFFLGISGKSSCDCFGKVHVSPWWTFSIDAALVILLYIWKPRRVSDDFEPDSGYVRFTAGVLLVIATLFAVIGIPALSISVKPPGSNLSIESALANSRFVLLEPEKWVVSYQSCRASSCFLG